jgi:protein O-GlcNAc transferase
MNINDVMRSAIYHYKNGSLEQAEALCRKILTKKPKHADAFNLLGLISYERRNFDAAIAHIKTALQYDPFNSYYYNNLGTAYKAKKELNEALIYYRRAVQLNPAFAEAYNNLGSLLQWKRELDEAMACYRKALQLSPKYADAYFNLGTAFRVKGQPDEAIRYYLKALQLNPNLVEAHNNLGALFKERGELHEALIYFKKVLELRPQFVEAFNNIGSILGDQGKMVDAEKYYRQALHLNPDFAVCHSNLLLTMNYSSRYDTRAIYLEHLSFAKRFAEPLSSGILPHTNDRTSQRPLKIGYVSPDFRRHPVGYFIKPILTSHDREQFEVFCYSDVISPDEITKLIQAYSFHWRDIVGMTDEQAAALVRSDKIDILVDLAGHTSCNRMLLFARKPAPVQASWLGYPNTTGLPTMDYRIVDNYTDPPGMTDPFYTEKLMRMSETFLCYHPEKDSPEVGPLPALRSGHVTLGSFNIISKVSPEAISVWSHILREIPNSRLLLKAKSLFDKGTRQYLADLFKQQGITEDRLALMSYTESYNEHLGTYNKIDVGLDTFPYNGTATTCEAAWMGVPVVTLAGERHASRVGLSLLSNIGIPDLAATTEDEYIDKAVKLAVDFRKLQSLREKLRLMMLQSPLTNAGRFTANLEDCYRAMWQAYCYESTPPASESVI